MNFMGKNENFYVSLTNNNPSRGAAAAFRLFGLLAFLTVAVLAVIVIAAR